ncbi:hypothetical protein J2T13_002971 [Paenibacillus sp. DS2015]
MKRKLVLLITVTSFLFLLAIPTQGQFNDPIIKPLIHGGVNNF